MLQIKLLIDCHISTLVKYRAYCLTYYVHVHAFMVNQLVQGITAPFNM
jgi:hypothetical protein